MVILVVEDDTSCRATVTRLLERDGFQTIDAIDGLDGYRFVKELEGSIDLLLSDIQMPRMDGISLAASVRELYPKMPILLMTGYTLPNQNPMGYALLRKPFSSQALTQAVRDIIGPAATEQNRPDSHKPTDASPAQSLQELRIQLKNAKEQYHDCSRRYREAFAEQNQGLTPAPDGSFAARQVLMQESAALQEYIRLLKILNDAIVSDKPL